MAKKRKLARNNSTPPPELEPETQSQAEPELEPEPIEEEQPPIKEDKPEVKEEKQHDDEEDEPLTVENPNHTPDPAAAEDDEGDSDPASLQILELFPKDQLVHLLCDAAARHADVRQEVHSLADVDPALRKVFVYGLGLDTNAKVLTDVFSQYGEIEDLNAVTDKATGKSKGYAFILFKHWKGAQSALREPQKKIGNRMTSCQLASAGPGPQHAAPATAVPPVSEYTQRKIFVSNVGVDIDPHKLLEFFAKFGEIEEGPLGLDKATGKPRGFCLFVYKTIESVRKALEKPHKNFEGHVLHCQKAVDGLKNKPGFQFQNQHGAGAQYPGCGPKGNSSGGVGSHMPAGVGGHLMAPPATGLGYQAAAALTGGTGQPMALVAGLNPVVNQALTALILGGLGSAVGPAVKQGVPGQLGNAGTQGGYGSGLGGYGGQSQVQGGYGGSQMGQGGGVRGQQGYGHAGGGPPYMGHH